MPKDQNQLPEKHPEASAEQQRGNAHKNSVFYGEHRKLAVKASEIAGGVIVAAAVGLLIAGIHKYIAILLLLIGLSLLLFALYLMYLPTLRKQRKSVRAKIKTGFIVGEVGIVLICGIVLGWPWISDLFRQLPPSTASAPPEAVEPPETLAVAPAEQAPSTASAKGARPDIAVSAPLVSRKNDEPKNANINQTEKAAPLQDNRITNSPIVNSPGSVQAPGGNVTLSQAPPARTLTVDQYREIVRYLKTKSKTSVTVLSTMTGGQEAADLANVLYAVLKDAGWTMETIGPGVFSGSFKGIWICTESEQNVAAASLQHALRTFDFKSVDGQRWAGVGEKVTVIVGGRP